MKILAYYAHVAGIMSVLISEEILVKNNLGRELKISTKDDLDEHCMRNSIASDYDYQHLLDTFLSVDAGDAGAISTNGHLALFTPGYRMVDDISVSPYQSLMFPLKHQRKGSRRRKRYAASGFKPYLTIVPKSDSLDSITRELCVAIVLSVVLVIISRCPSTSQAHTLHYLFSTSQDIGSHTH